MSEPRDRLKEIERVHNNPRPPIDRSGDICTGRAKYGPGRPEQGRVKCDRCTSWHLPLTRAEIAASKVPVGKLTRLDIDWLIGEVKRLRKEAKDSYAQGMRDGVGWGEDRHWR